MNYRLRELDLPYGVPGRLFLSHMPGRCLLPSEAVAAFAEARARLTEAGVAVVVCLTPGHEVEQLAPAYAAARDAGDVGLLPWRAIDFPIEDLGVASDREAFRAVVHQAAGELQAGTILLAHCAAGIGRTGLFAASVLIALGRPLDLAVTDVRAAGSHVESHDQEGVLAWLASVEGVEIER